MVQDVLGTTEAVVLPTTEQATNMVTSGWQANKVFDAVDTKDKADTEDKADTDGENIYHNSSSENRLTWRNSPSL